MGTPGIRRNSCRRPRRVRRGESGTDSTRSGALRAGSGKRLGSIRDAATALWQYSASLPDIVHDRRRHGLYSPHPQASPAASFPALITTFAGAKKAAAPFRETAAFFVFSLERRT